MAYQKKYYFPFVPMGLTEEHVVEIWQDTATVLTAEEITAGVPPFVVEMPDLDTKFQTVRGSGCIMNLLSDTDMKFFDGLYTDDLKGFMVLHYIDSSLDWCGYLNSEMISEPYDQSKNYIINLTGNDGLNLIERLFFLDDSEAKFSGLKTEWEILQIILDKISLPYNDIRISISTEIVLGVGTESPLQETILDCENFYDEDGTPMNLREVAESILQPYGAFIIQSEGSIYITDVNTMSGGGNVTYNRYSASTYAYIDDVVIDNEKTVTEIGYLGTGQQIERSGGTNRQLVTYSPYPVKEITGEKIVYPSEFSTVPSSYSIKDGYYYKTLSGHNYYTSSNHGGFEESRKDLNSEPFIYYRHPLDTVNSVFLNIDINKTQFLNVLSSTPLSFDLAIGSQRYLDGTSISISANVLVKTKANPYDETYTESELDLKADKVTNASILSRLSIGDKYSDSFSFFDTVKTFDFEISDNGEIISNKWINVERRYEVTEFFKQELINGKLQFILFSDTKVKVQGEEEQNNSEPLQEIWIRNLNIRLVSRDGTEISDSDIEYVSELNKKLEKKGEDIVLTTGTSTFFSDRGKKCIKLGVYYFPITLWTRGGQSYSIEELLLNSLSSNYRSGYITLMNMSLKNDFSIMNVITDAYTGTSKLMTKRYSRDYYGNVTNIDLVEISEDELTIVKE